LRRIVRAVSTRCRPLEGPPLRLTLDAARHETSHRFPQFLDGRHYIYLVNSSRLEHRGIFLGSIGSTERNRLTDAESNAVFARGLSVVLARYALMAQRLISIGRSWPGGSCDRRSVPAPS
jgi:hypothetical protein